ncbi:fluoride efflux transporter CrcB [Erythrobacter sp. WH131]|uniref:Fluoride-specific ion channel FluC n=2 Tax=Erythrobacter ani TaxID=2827235 RepID=A0ABS6SIW3_9SPHN|nr:fluoride efflux transporter CrcB [Erythrobacter ani]
MAASATVAIGGAIGAVGRYQLGRVFAQHADAGTALPWGTLAANVLGCLAMGVLFGWLARTGHTNETLRLLLGVGLLGGFTTFSAFGLEMMLLIQRGAAGLAVSYAAVSVLAGLGALYIGLLIMRGAA